MSKILKIINNKYGLVHQFDMLWLEWLEYGNTMRLPVTDADHAQRIADAIDDQWGEK